MASGALRHAAGIDKNERRTMNERELGEPAVDLLPDFVRHDCFERRRRNLDREISRANVAGVDDDAIVAAFVPPAARPGLAFGDQTAVNLLEGLLRRGQTEARRRQGCQRREALERQGEMAAALVARERVDFV